MGRVRVLLVDLPHLVSDVITQLLAGEERVEVVASLRSPDLESAVRQHSADVIVLPADHSDLPSAGRRFLEDRGNVRVVGLVDNARSGFVGRLAVEMVRIDEVSRATLVEAITSGMQPAWHRHDDRATQARRVVGDDGT